MGAFIVLEGGEGSGKSTQARLLYQRLTSQGYSSLLLHEPGGTQVGEQIGRLLKTQGRGMTPLTELLLFAAARAQLVEKVLRPALKAGEVVVCDRYIYSTIAYQGYGRGVPLKTIQQLNQMVASGLEPDLGVLLDIDPEEGLRRVKAQGALAPDGEGSPASRVDEEEGRQRFEAEPLKFHQRVREGYLAMAKAEPERWLVVDATLPVDAVAEAIWQRVGPLLGRAGT